MTTLAEAAATAAEAERVAREEFLTQLRDVLITTCRQSLSVWSKGAVDPVPLEVAYVDLDAFLVVLTDGAVPLAVYDDGRVFLVAGSGSSWTRKAGPLSSLAALHTALGSN